MAESVSDRISTPLAADDGPGGEHEGLRGHLGTWGIAATVFAYTSPAAGAASYVSLLIGYGNGLGAPLLYVACGLIILLFAVGFLALVRHVPRPGAFYSYITTGLGKRMGLGAGMMTLYMYIQAMVFFWIFGGIAASNLINDSFGVDLPWWFYVIIGLPFVGAISYRGVDLNAKLLGIVVAFEFGILLVFSLVTMVTGGESGHTAEPFTWDAVSGGAVAVAFLFGMGIFFGFESTAIFREEARDPVRTIPRATYAVIAGLALAYALTTYALIVALGPDNVVAAAAADPVGSFTDGLGNTFGDASAKLISVIIVTSVIASEIAICNVVSRYVYSFSVDRVLPRRLDAVHPRHGSPHRASLATSAVTALAVLVVALSQVDPVVAYGTMGGVGIFAFEVIVVLVSLSVIVYFRRNRGTGEPIWKVLVAPLLAIVAFGWLLYYGATNASLLLGVPTKLTPILFTIAGLSFAGGVAYASWAAVRKPDTYARIGRAEG